MKKKIIKYTLLIAIAICSFQSVSAGTSWYSWHTWKDKEISKSSYHIYVGIDNPISTGRVANCTTSVSIKQPTPYYALIQQKGYVIYSGYGARNGGESVIGKAIWTPGGQHHHGIQSY